MEGLPTTTENDSEKKDFSTKKKKKTEVFGALLVEPKTETNPAQPEVRRSLWQTLTKPETENPDTLKDEALIPNGYESVEASEAEAPLETLGEEEKLLIESQLVQSSAENVAGAISPEAAEAEEETAIESFHHKIIVEGKDSEQAFAETLDELGVVPRTDETGGQSAIENESPALQVEQTSQDESSEPESAETDIYSAPVALGTVEAWPPGTGEPANLDQREVQASGGGQGGAKLPPIERADSWGGQPPEDDFRQMAAPAGQLQTSARSEYVPQYQEANPAATALLGGIIGYLIGRRRGRIKTEKKLLPIQKKLEKEVVDLQWEIRRKEKAIRKAAVQRNWEQRSRVKGMPLETSTNPPQSRQQEAPTHQATEKNTPEKRYVEQRIPAPEANQLHGKRSPELIGQVLLSAEAKPAKKPNKDNAVKAETPQRVETLNRAELLGLSEKIIVDGTSLRQVYETKLVGERGLRRLVAEHLKGGDIKKTLRRELVEHEIDYERDPIMRDHQPADTTAGGGASLYSLLQKADKSIDDDNREAAFYESRANYQAERQAAAAKQRRRVDFGLAGIITVLTALVAVLLITRS